MEVKKEIINKIILKQITLRAIFQNVKHLSIYNQNKKKYTNLKPGNILNIRFEILQVLDLLVKVEKWQNVVSSL